MRRLLLSLIAVLPFTVSAQIFYVQPTKLKYGQSIGTQLKYEGYKVTTKREFADYIVVCWVEMIGKYDFWRTRNEFKGRVYIVNAETREEVSSTRELLILANNEKNAGHMMEAEVSAKYMRILMAPFWEEDQE